MKILITGANGFIAKNLGKFLSSDHEIYGYEWNDTNFPDVTGLDWVIHLGAISSTTETDVDKVILQNYEFSKWLFLQCNDKKVNFQYASSASVYGSTTHFTENGPLQPISPYSWSKYLFDRWVKNQDKQILCQGFRYFNVYGTGEEHKGDQASVFTKFAKQSQEKDWIEVFEGSENYKRDFVCVKDVCNIHKLFFDIEQSGIWNLGTGQCWSFADIAEAMSQKMSVPVKEIPIPQQLSAQYQKYTCANTSHLIETIGNYKFIDPFEYISSL
jgi:ADP-L-glycero-D-manno-heptose 6-epimerase